MSSVKSLWAYVQGDPTFMRRVNGWLTIFWIVMIPVSIATGWISSVTYVAALSLWALVSGHWAAWQAARVEVNQEKDEDRLPREIAERVLAELEKSRSAHWDVPLEQALAELESTSRSGEVDLAEARDRVISD